MRLGAVLITDSAYRRSNPAPDGTSLQGNTAGEQSLKGGTQTHVTRSGIHTEEYQRGDPTKETITDPTNATRARLRSHKNRPLTRLDSPECPPSNTDQQNDITRWSALIQQIDPTNITACGSVREQQHIAWTGSHRASAALTSLQCDLSTKALDTPTMRWQQWDGDDGDDDFAALDVDAPPMDEPARTSGTGGRQHTDTIHTRIHTRTHMTHTAHSHTYDTHRTLTHI